MSSDPGHAWLDGRMVGWPEARLPIEDRGLQFGESLYEVVPVTRGQARLVPEHAQRMVRGAEALDLASGVPDHRQWLEIARHLIEADGVEEGLLYAQLTGGVAPRRHVPEPPPRPVFLAYLRRHRFPRQQAVDRGARAVSVADVRWGRCDLKTTMLLGAVLAKREAARQGVDEALLVGESNEVREGASTTLHLVQGERLVTPPASTQILSGTTRGAVAALARQCGIEITEAPIHLDEVFRADEVFVTSTSLLVMPLVEVDSKPVGNGRSGPVSCRLAKALRQQLELD
jgi:D-alanine transaminase